MQHKAGQAAKINMAKDRRKTRETDKTSRKTVAETSVRGKTVSVKTNARGKKKSQQIKINDKNFKQPLYTLKKL